MIFSKQWLSKMLRILKYRSKDREEKATKPRRSKRSVLIAEIEKAKNEWLLAREKLDYAIEADEIDYAIFAFETAEKRYEMLLRQAKRLKLDARVDQEGIGE